MSDYFAINGRPKMEDRITKIGSIDHASPVPGPRSSVTSAASFLVQPWCNQSGKDGNYGRNGQIVVLSIERMDPSTTPRTGSPSVKRMDTPNSKFEVKCLS
jgi:hypothetical protein